MNTIHSNTARAVFTRGPADLVIATCCALLAIPSTVDASLAAVPLPLANEDFVAADVSEAMAPGTIMKKLGPPGSILTNPDPLDNQAEMVTWRYPGIDIELEDESTIRGIRLTDPRFRTRRGLAVGDKTGQVKKLYGKPSGKYMSDWDYAAPDDALHVMRVRIEQGRVKWIYLGWLHD